MNAREAPHKTLHDALSVQHCERLIRDIADFPKPGILFKDITPLLADGPGFRAAVEHMAEIFEEQRLHPEILACPEARGFIFAAPLALELSAAFVPIRKPGKLPFETHAFHYELEYGKDTLEMHIDGVANGQNVLVVDDLLATGGTVDACCKLLERSGANVVGCAFLIELAGLGGAERIGHRETYSLIRYD